MSTYKIFTKNVFLIGAVYVLGALSSILVLPVITKFLGIKDYASWVQLKGLVTLITPLIILGLPSAIVRFLAAEKDKKEIQEGVYSVMALVFFIAFVVAFLIFIFSGLIGNFFQCDPDLVKIISLVIILESLNIIILDALIAFQELKKYSLILIFQTAFEILLVIGAVFYGFGLLGAVLAVFFARFSVFLILAFYLVKKIGLKIPRFSPIKKYLNFSVPLLADVVSYWVVASSDRYLINFFLGVIFVGYYVPAYALGSVLGFFIYPLTFVLTAVLPKLFDEKKMEETKTCLKFSVKYFLLLAIPAVFGISFLSKPLLGVFSTWEIARRAYFITPFVALSFLFYGLSALFGNNLILAKKTKISAVIWTGSAALNLVLNFIFIPVFGILAAGITTFLSYLFSFILIWFFAFKQFKFGIDWVFILKSILASFVMALFILWQNPIGLSKTIATIIFSVIIYGVLVLLFRGIKLKEIYFFKNILNKQS